MWIFIIVMIPLYHMTKLQHFAFVVLIWSSEQSEVIQEKRKAREVKLWEN